MGLPAHMVWGLTHTVYRDAYSASYLVNLSRNDRRQNNIIDVVGLPKVSVKKLIVSGYGYAVLGRKQSTGIAAP